ncbi:pimeloyl-ACP methyl ester esterase BioH [Alteromonas pelagimontana]|uniref:Pimeloyl-ACP methyl ester esterase BioH n=2 Tax=Alteromonas pelagimontana TaxID=1858656 RepID=A0A6M4MI69_9ALTE|nr:pimeloyl-ACP methyl ester esterase BioH [Alteromonas pelagimontana]QJR82793.1 pimeloyl-ACP methyl ester esterase BioH [Alteromonas pelagimontana]
MNSGVFSEFVPYLSEDFAVTTIDLPGFGENNAVVPSPYTIASLSDAIAPVLPSSCVVIGWSLGGLVAQQLALSQPDVVTDLVTIASTPRFLAGPGWPGIAGDLLNQFEQQLAKDYAKTLERFLAIQAMGSPSAKQDIKTIRKRVAQFPQPSSVALKDALRLLSEEDLRQHIGRIRQPTLRLYGRLDSLVPTSGIDRICELQPNSDTVVLPHASHAPFISHPQQSADIVRQFVSSRK